MKTLYDWASEDDENQDDIEEKFSQIIMASYLVGEIVDINKIAAELSFNDEDEEDG